MPSPTYEEIDAVLADLVAPSDGALDHALATSTEGGLPQIQVAVVQGKFLELLVRAIGASTVLEVGTLGGYSTIHLARGIRPGGKVTTLELDEHHADVARANFVAAGPTMTSIRSSRPALESIRELQASGYGPVDFMFIDADKPNNTNYARAGLELSHPGTLLVVDNVVRGGSIAIDPLPDDYARGAHDVISFMGSEPRIDSTALQVVGQKGHDGLLFGLVTS